MTKAKYTNTNKEYKIPVSERFYGRIRRASKLLGVSQKNLVLFLIADGFDRLSGLSGEEKYKQFEKSLDKYLADKHKAEYEKTSYNKKTREMLDMKCTLSLRIRPYVEDTLVDLRDQLSEIKPYHGNKKTKINKSDVLISILYLEWDVISDMLHNYLKDDDFPDDDMAYQNDQIRTLKCVGISCRDFERISVAIIFSELFERSFSEICRRWEYGKEEVSERTREYITIARIPL